MRRPSTASSGLFAAASSTMSRRPTSPPSRPSWLSEGESLNHSMMNRLFQDVRNRNDSDEFTVQPAMQQQPIDPALIDRDTLITGYDAVQEPSHVGGAIPSPSSPPASADTAMEVSEDPHSSSSGQLLSRTALRSVVRGWLNNSREHTRSAALSGHRSPPQIGFQRNDSNRPAIGTARETDRLNQRTRQNLRPGSHTFASANESHASGRNATDSSSESHMIQNRLLSQVSRLETRTADDVLSPNEQVTTGDVVGPRLLLHDHSQVPATSESEASSSLNANPRIKRRRATSLTSSRSERGIHISSH